MPFQIRSHITTIKETTCRQKYGGTFGGLDTNSYKSEEIVNEPLNQSQTVVIKSFKTSSNEPCKDQNIIVTSDKKSEEPSKNLNIIKSDKKFEELSKNSKVIKSDKKFEEIGKNIEVVRSNKKIEEPSQNVKVITSSKKIEEPIQNIIEVRTSSKKIEEPSPNVKVITSSKKYEEINKSTTRVIPVRVRVSRG